MTQIYKELKLYSGLRQFIALNDEQYLYLGKIDTSKIKLLNSCIYKKNLSPSVAFDLIKKNKKD